MCSTALRNLLAAVPDNDNLRTYWNSPKCIYIVTLHPELPYEIIQIQHNVALRMPPLVIIVPLRYIIMCPNSKMKELLTSTIHLHKYLLSELFNLRFHTRTLASKSNTILQNLFHTLSTHFHVILPIFYLFQCSFCQFI